MCRLVVMTCVAVSTLPLSYLSYAAMSSYTVRYHLLCALYLYRTIIFYSLTSVILTDESFTSDQCGSVGEGLRACGSADALVPDLVKILEHRHWLRT